MGTSRYCTHTTHRTLTLYFTTDARMNEMAFGGWAVYHNVPMKKCDEADQLPFAMKKRELEDMPLWDHCLASSAAPTYFKSHVRLPVSTHPKLALTHPALPHRKSMLTVASCPTRLHQVPTPP